MGLLEAIVRLFFYNITTIKEIVPNLILGLTVGLLSSAILHRLSKVDKEYITFTRNHFFFLLMLLSVGVVVTSPLRADSGEWLKTVSILLCLVCLSVCSYTDCKTGTVIVGYVLLGMLLQGIFLVWHIVNGNLMISVFERNVLIILTIMFLVFCLVRAYTLADLGLIYMNMMCILISTDELRFVFGVLMIMTAFITVVIRDLVFRIPKWKKNGKKGKLKFPFTLHIQLGMMVVLFFI